VVEPPLGLRREYLAKRFLLKRSAYKNHPLLNSLDTLNSIYTSDRRLSLKTKPLLCSGLEWVSMLYKGPKYDFPSIRYSISANAIFHIPNIVRNIGLHKNSIGCKFQANQMFLERVNTEWPTHIKIFTDGSKTEQIHTGSGIYIQDLKIKEKYKLPLGSSVFTAECFALKEALNIVQNREITKAIIFSDSLSL
jgi:hypothetical protein